MNSFVRSRPRRKYLKVGSLTWWTGAIPLVTGVFIGTVEVHELHAWVNSINSITGDIPASAMIIYGLTAIGLRGKDD